jgi:predicted ATPase
VKRVLLTGMSGTGKSTLIGELAARGYKAVDLDADEWSEWVDVEFIALLSTRWWRRCFSSRTYARDRSLSSILLKTGTGKG